MGEEDFAETCRRIYFPAEKYSLSTFIIANAGLYYIFLEEGYRDPTRSAKENLAQYAHQSQENLEIALSNLPLFTPPRAETIQAMLLGVRTGVRSWASAQVADTVVDSLRNRFIANVASLAVGVHVGLDVPDTRIPPTNRSRPPARQQGCPAAPLLALLPARQRALSQARPHISVQGLGHHHATHHQ